MRNLAFALLASSVLCALCGCASDKGSAPALASAPTPAVTAVGDAQGEAATVMIGPAGGTVVSADGNLTLVVPVGALAADTPLSVTPLSVTAPGGVRAYRLGPEGTTFAAPASVRFTFTDADVAGSSKDALRVAFQDGQRQWEAINALTVDTNSVAVATTHLSDWSLLLGYQIRPAAANVAASAKLNLAVRYCGVVTKDAQGKDLELVGLVADCQEDGLDPLLGAWAVNGVTGGSSTTGTVLPGQPAVYTAPGTPPSPAIVAVSVEFTPPRPGERKTLLVSNLTIGGALPRTYSGTLTYHLKVGGPATSILPYEENMTAQVSLTRKPTSASSYALTTSTAVLTQMTKDTDSSCHCTVTNVAGALDPAGFSLILNAKSGTISDFQFGALFEGVTYTCTPVVCQPTMSVSESVVWALVGTNPACAADVKVGFTDPKQLSGSWSLTCPVNPQTVGRIEEATWSLQGAD